MILVDTSVWIDHFRSGDAALTEALNRGRVLTHPFIVGELALGNFRQRKTVVDALGNLPRAAVANDDEMLGFIERRALFGTGIGYVDAHLLASVALTPGLSLMTRDKRLSALAERLGNPAV